MSLESEDLVIPGTIDRPAAPIDWLWEPYLTAGSLAILDGDPGVGKSFVALDLAARLSAGLPMPDGGPPPAARCRVLVASGEDVIEDTLLPRFRAAGGDPEQLCFFGGLSRGRPAARPAQFPRDLDALARHLRSAPAALAVLDPIMALLPASVSASHDQGVREVLTPLARLAAETGTCFLFVRHLTKAGGGKSLYRGCGSIGITGAVRSAMLAGVHPDAADRRVLSVTKSNLASPGRSLAFRLAEREGGFGVAWDGPTNLTADDLCREDAADDAPSKKAERWLFMLLLRGPVPATRVEAEAAAQGIGFATLRAVKKQLGVESRRVKRDGKEFWEWRFPDNGLPPLEPLR